MSQSLMSALPVLRYGSQMPVVLDNLRRQPMSDSVGLDGFLAESGIQYYAKCVHFSRSVLLLLIRDSCIFCTTSFIQVKGQFCLWK
jgi:hypothetical protein